uniref:potassium channel subfamily K member 13-like n=1 Tax=Myxine glutinosa TaxID=7769 RepID=UPI00358EAE0B
MRTGVRRRRQYVPTCLLRAGEDNARFVLLASCIIIYILGGAGIFIALEKKAHDEKLSRWNAHLQNFSTHYRLPREELDKLLERYELSYIATWNFYTSFSFVCTVLSTIGFGRFTPVTVAGRLFLILYGLVGCSATILFFNLFLERLIIILTFSMKAFQRLCHCLKCRRTSEVFLEGWKPSVYCVMLILWLMVGTVIVVASGLFVVFEDWAFVDAIYFCFVAFSTIGFGDMLSGYRKDKIYPRLYLATNFFLIVFGVCCLYSLFNVLSIVIKQGLNRALHFLGYCPQANGSKCTTASRSTPKTMAVSAGSCNDRRNSGEMMSMHGFLNTSNASLSLMELETSNQAKRAHAHHDKNGDGSPRPNGGGVRMAPLRIFGFAETS